MDAILQQLGINETVFVQFGLFIFLFFFLSKVYFKPFLALIQERHKRTIEDKEAAVQLMKQAEEKFSNYTNKLQEERIAARLEYEKILTEAKIEENKILAQARDEAKLITQATLENIASQKEQLQKQLFSEVEGMSKKITEQLLGSKI